MVGLPKVAAAERVVDQVAQRDAQCVHVAADRPRCATHLQLQLAAAAGLGELIDHQHRRLHQVDRGALQRHAGLHPRQLQQPGGQAGQPVELAQQGLGLLTRAWVGAAVHQALGLGACAGQRGAQFVRGVGGEGALAVHQAGHPCQQPHRAQQQQAPAQLGLQAPGLRCGQCRRRCVPPQAAQRAHGRAGIGVGAPGCAVRAGFNAQAGTPGRGGC